MRPSVTGIKFSQAELNKMSPIGDKFMNRSGIFRQPQPRWVKWLKMVPLLSMKTKPNTVKHNKTHYFTLFHVVSRGWGSGAHPPQSFRCGLPVIAVFCSFSPFFGINFSFSFLVSTNFLSCYPPECSQPARIF
jgi:hypothetical protein